MMSHPLILAPTVTPHQIDPARQQVLGGEHRSSFVINPELVPKFYMC